METDSVNYEPPTKATKIDVQQYPSFKGAARGVLKGLKHPP